MRLYMLLATHAFLHHDIPLAHAAYNSAADVAARAAGSGCPPEFGAAARRGDFSLVCDWRRLCAPPPPSASLLQLQSRIVWGLARACAAQQLRWYLPAVGTHLHAHARTQTRIKTITPPHTQAATCFVLDLDLRAFLVASGVPYAAAANATVAAALAAGDASPQITTGVASTSSGGAAAGPAGGPSGSGSSVDAAAVAVELDSFFYGELALTEGAPFACPLHGVEGSPPREQWCGARDVGALKGALLRAGLLLRAHGPQQVLRGHEALMVAQAAATGGSHPAAPAAS